MANALDAKREWIEAALEEGIKINEPDNLEDYSGQFKLRLPCSLHRLLAEHSKREGISIVCIFFQEMMLFIQSKNDNMILKKWQHFSNRKSASQNKRCN